MLSKTAALAVSSSSCSDLLLRRAGMGQTCSEGQAHTWMRSLARSHSASNACVRWWLRGPGSFSKSGAEAGGCGCGGK
jgi:hypothetical protein